MRGRLDPERALSLSLSLCYQVCEEQSGPALLPARERAPAVQGVSLSLSLLLLLHGEVSNPAATWAPFMSAVL